MKVGTDDTLKSLVALWKKAEPGEARSGLHEWWLEHLVTSRGTIANSEWEFTYRKGTPKHDLWVRTKRWVVAERARRRGQKK